MQPPRTKHWPWVVGVTAILAGAGVFLGQDRGAPAVAEATAGSSAETATMGTPVTQDGIFEYDVTSLDCRRATVGGVVPKGHFCVVDFTVHNLSRTARKPGISFARAYDARGTAYLADPVAQIRNGSSLLDDLAPDARLTDHLIYDVPKTATITSLVLRESPASAGITIPLS